MSDSDDLTEFERAVLLKLVAGDQQALKVLQAQAQSVRVTDREWHGTAGFATDLAVDPAAPWFGNYINFDVSDVTAKISGMRHPTIYVVFVRAGRLADLEGTAFEDEPWPDPIVDFELSYLDEPRRRLELPVAHFGDTELPAAYQGLYDAIPPDWYVGQVIQRRDGAWEVYAFDETEDPRFGRRKRTRTVVGHTEAECVREMARCLRGISAGRVPK